MNKTLIPTLMYLAFLGLVFTGLYSGASWLWDSWLEHTRVGEILIHWLSPIEP